MYHPKSFELLRDWLQALEQVAETANKLPIQKFIQTQSVLSTSSMLRVAEEAGVDSACERAISEASTESRRRRHLHTWFDAFRTLKWLHAVRNAGLADLEWREALRNAQFLQATESEMAIHRAEVVRRMLSHLDMPTKSLTESSRFAQNSIAVHS